jgi:hypothetical protein
VPRIKRKPKQGARDIVSTLGQLREALNVGSPTTTTDWRKRGMPEGPPWSVVAVYAWARGEGLHVDLPRDAELARLCKVATKARWEMPDTSTAALHKELIEVGLRLGIRPPVEFEIENEDQRALAWQRWAQSVKTAQGVLVEAKALVPMPVFRDRLRRISDTVIAQMNEVHGVAREVVNLSQVQRQQLRDAITRQVTLLRQRMSAGVNLSPEPSAPAPAAEEDDGSASDA